MKYGAETGQRHAPMMGRSAVTLMKTTHETDLQEQ